MSSHAVLTFTAIIVMSCCFVTSCFILIFWFSLSVSIVLLPALVFPPFWPLDHFWLCLVVGPSVMILICAHLPSYVKSPVSGCHQKCLAKSPQMFAVLNLSHQESQWDSCFCFFHVAFGFLEFCILNLEDIWSLVFRKETTFLCSYNIMCSRCGHRHLHNIWQ